MADDIPFLQLFPEEPWCAQRPVAFHEVGRDLRSSMGEGRLRVSAQWKMSMEAPCGFCGCFSLSGSGQGWEGWDWFALHPAIGPPSSHQAVAFIVERRPSRFQKVMP